MAKCSSVVLPNYGVQFALRFPGAFWSQVAHSTRDILVSCISLNRSEVDSIAQQRGYIRPPEPVQRPFLALTAFRFAPLAAPTIQFRLPDQYLERKKELAVRIPVFGSEDERLVANVDVGKLKVHEFLIAQAALEGKQDCHLHVRSGFS